MFINIVVYFSYYLIPVHLSIVVIILNVINNLQINCCLLPNLYISDIFCLDNTIYCLTFRIKMQVEKNISITVTLWKVNLLLIAYHIIYNIFRIRVIPLLKEYHNPRNVYSLQNLGKARNKFLVGKEHFSSDTLILAPYGLFWTSDLQNSTLIILPGFKQQNLWLLVTIAIGN